MPKKTKKEKIIAEYRRKLSTTSISSAKIVSDPIHTPIESTSVFTQTFSLKQTKQKNNSYESLMLEPQEFMAIKKDLIITLALTLFILIGQVGIWKILE
jgi:hypothetical protein